MESNDGGAVETQVTAMILRCECGVVVSAATRENLVEEARIHFEDMHPTVGPGIAAEMILAMAEEVHI